MCRTARPIPIGVLVKHRLHTGLQVPRVPRADALKPRSCPLGAACQGFRASSAQRVHAVRGGRAAGRARDLADLRARAARARGRPGSRARGVAARGARRGAGAGPHDRQLPPGGVLLPQRGALGDGDRGLHPGRVRRPEHGRRDSSSGRPSGRPDDHRHARAANGAGCRRLCTLPRGCRGAPLRRYAARVRM